MEHISQSHHTGIEMRNMVLEHISEATSQSHHTGIEICDVYDVIINYFAPNRTILELKSVCQFFPVLP